MLSASHNCCPHQLVQVFIYHKAFPMPVLSYKFSTTDPISGQENDDASQFVSCVCWRGQSSTLLAANSSGNIKFLEMVQLPIRKLEVMSYGVTTWRFLIRTLRISTQLRLWRICQSSVALLLIDHRRRCQHLYHSKRFGKKTERELFCVHHSYIINQIN